MTLRHIDLMGGRRRVKHPQQREPKARRINVAQLNVPTVTVPGIGTPTLADIFHTVSLAHVLTGAAQSLERAGQSQETAQALHQRSPRPDNQQL